MVTAKRLYLYGVLAVVLLPLLMGLSDLLGLVLDGLSDATGGGMLSGSHVAREDLSLAIALVAVGAPLWAIHFWLLQRTVRDSADIAEERSSPVRATYFFLVLVSTGIVAVVFSVETLSALMRAVLIGERLLDLGNSFANVLVFGSAWLIHLAWRARDLRTAPERTAGDWLTRLYLYGALFVLGLTALFSASETITSVLREAAGLRPVFETAGEWKEALAGLLAVVVVAAVMWLGHWALAARLTRAPDPMGSAHRESRTRVGYLLGVVLFCAATVLMMLSSSLRHAFAEMAGVWSPSGSSRVAEDVVGPILASVPFVTAWWWHARRAAAEARIYGGPDRHASVTRAGRLLVSLVGLGGLAVGVAWGIESALGLFDYWSSRDVVSASILRDGGTPAAASALVGLVMWLPAWVLLQRERAASEIVAARSTARRAYLLLVSGLSLLGVMGSLSWLLFQAIRTGLDAGRPQDTDWAIGVLLVATSILGYHLLKLRSDLAITKVVTEAQPAPEPAIVEDAAGGTVEALEIKGPSGADFEVLNADIRSRLPEGYTLRVLPGPAADDRSKAPDGLG